MYSLSVLLTFQNKENSGMVLLVDDIIIVMRIVVL